MSDFHMTCPHCGKEIKDAIKVVRNKEMVCPKCSNLMDKHGDTWYCRFSLCNHQQKESEDDVLYEPKRR